MEEQIARIIYKYQGDKSVNYKYNGLYPVLFEMICNQGLDLDVVEEYVDKNKSLPSYIN